MSPTSSHTSYPIGLCIPCTKPGCNQWFKNQSGYTQYMNAKHPVFPQQFTLSQPSRPFSPSPGPPDTIDFRDDATMDNSDPVQQTAEFFNTGNQLYRNYHPFLSAQPCDLEGNFLPPGTSPPPLTDKAPDNWTPYKSRVEPPTHSIDHLLNIWVASLIQAGSKSTIFSDHRSVYKAIDNTPLGDVKWQSFTVKYSDEIPEEGAAPWMADSHEVWFRDPCEVICNMLANPDFAVEMDLRPYHEFATENDKRQWKDFMSGDWAYQQADIIAEDTDTHGSTFMPVILGSDKTTVSVATGQNDYYPLYVSIGNALDETSLLRSRLHVDALIKECDFDTLWAEYGVIAVLVPFTNDFPCTDIHELLAPDLLHQIIKGSFKDHLVEWTIFTDVPPFPGLRRFPQGCHFKQWTSDDLKALMKIYLPAIDHHVPGDIVHVFSAFLQFCYLVRHNVLTEKSLKEIHDALARFHQYREIFKTTGTVTTFSLPQQHSMTHYVHCIRLFGAPNGLCSLITESKHIKAIKEPWRRSSRYNALSQMLLTNQRLDKLMASHVYFHTCGMLSGTCLSSILAALEPSADVPAQAVPTSAEGHNSNQQELPIVCESASVPDIDVIADSEDIDAPTSVLAHVQLARTSHKREKTSSLNNCIQKCMLQKFPKALWTALIMKEGFEYSIPQC
ncbi:hypothetical protein BD769DRAFT_1674733 [Suillus cothurnatus]|nr:hypothetical protein BD769DRAFT_1674733 [Suillus cothurnatus]